MMDREAAEVLVRVAVGWLRLGVEIVGALIVAAGIVLALAQCARAVLQRQGSDFNAIRLVLARYLALALEFQLGADILSTAIAPSWDDIGRLGVIAIIRTGLNYFLGQEMREEQELVVHEKPVHARAGGDTFASKMGAWFPVLCCSSCFSRRFRLRPAGFPRRRPPTLRAARSGRAPSTSRPRAATTGPEPCRLPTKTAATGP